MDCGEVGFGASPTNTSSNQTIDLSEDQKPPNAQGSKHSNLGRAIAYRALFGSCHRRGSVGHRKTANNDARLLPSRLSKISLSENSEN